MSQRPQLSCYQWEATYAADFTLDGIMQRCQQLTEVLIAHKWSCLIAHDTRFMAGHFAHYIYNNLAAQGVQVSLCPTPAPFPSVELALEQRRADTALIISASNRHFWYNGLIILAPPDSGALMDVQGLPAMTTDLALPFPPPSLDLAELNQVDLRSPYIEMLRDTVDIDLIRRTPLTVFVDPMNGTTSGYIPTTLGEGGQTKAIEINRELDPLFGRQPPQPSETGLNRLRKLVKESDSHLGIAVSADGRALGVADNLGEIVPAGDLALLIAQYLSRQYRQRGIVIVPRAADTLDLPRVRSLEETHGVKVEAVADPSPRIAELLLRDRNNLLVGMTAAGELTMGHYSESSDAILAALLLIELAARSGSKLRPLLDELKGKG